MIARSKLGRARTRVSQSAKFGRCRPQPAQPQHFGAIDIGRGGRFGERVRITGEVRLSRERGFHLAEVLVEISDGLRHVRCGEPLCDRQALALPVSRVRHAGQVRLELRGRLAQEHLTVRSGESDCRGRRVKIVVDLLHPEARDCARVGIRGHQRRIRERLVEILDDERRFDDDSTVVREGRHHLVRIQPGVFRSMLVAVLQIERFAGPVEPFFRQRQPDFDGTDRCAAVVKVKHVCPPLNRRRGYLVRRRDLSGTLCWTTR